MTTSSGGKLNLPTLASGSPRFFQPDDDHFAVENRLHFTFERCGAFEFLRQRTADATPIAQLHIASPDGEIPLMQSLIPFVRPFVGIMAKIDVTSRFDHGEHLPDG